MHVTLVTLSGIKFSDDAREVRLKTPLGAMAILPHHEPITAITSPGAITIIDKANEEELFASFGGLLEVTNGDVRILLDEADHARDLVEEEIKLALEHAQELKTKAKDQTELAEAQRLIDRQAVRLEVAQIRRRYKN